MTQKAIIAVTDIDNVTLNLNGASKLAIKYRPYRIVFTLGGDSHEVASGDTLTMRCPDAFTLEEVRASVKTAAGLLAFDVKKNSVSMFSTLLTIDAGEKTSLTAAASAVLSTTAVAQDDELEISVSSDGGGNAFGATVVLMGKITLT